MTSGCLNNNRCCKHRSTTTITTKPTPVPTTIIPPSDYLALPQEKKQDNEELAVMALLSVTDDANGEGACNDRDDYDDSDSDDDDDESTILADLLKDMTVCCPDLFSRKAVIQELLRHGCDSIVMPVLTRQEISWDRELVLEALTRCNCFYPRLPMVLKEDPEVALGAIRKGTEPSEIPFDLLANKEFVLRALEADPGIFAECGEELGYDMDVLTKVFVVADCNLLSQLDDILRYKFEIEPSEVLVPLAQHVRKQLDSYEAFQTFLKCMSVSASRGQGILPLQLLQCGEETGVALKRNIATLLGASCCQSEIAKMKKVWDRVSSYCHRHSNSCCTGNVTIQKRNVDSVVGRQLVNQI